MEKRCEQSIIKHFELIRKVLELSKKKNQLSKKSKTKEISLYMIKLIFKSKRAHYWEGQESCLVYIKENTSCDVLSPFHNVIDR